MCDLHLTGYSIGTDISIGLSVGNFHNAIELSCKSYFSLTHQVLYLPVAWFPIWNTLNSNCVVWSFVQSYLTRSLNISSTLPSLIIVKLVVLLSSPIVQLSIPTLYSESRSATLILTVTISPTVRLVIVSFFRSNWIDPVADALPLIGVPFPSLFRILIYCLSNEPECNVRGGLNRGKSAFESFFHDG